MAKTVNLYEAKTHLSALVDRAADGEEIVIAKAGKPRARLLPVAAAQTRRRPGGGRGKVWVAADFDAPLPPDVLADMVEHATLVTHDRALAPYGVPTLWF
jgi:prevent-host-death family protein